MVGLLRLPKAYSEDNDVDAITTAQSLSQLGTLLNFYPLNEGEMETVYDYGEMENNGYFVGPKKPSWKQQFPGSQRNACVLEFPGREAAIELEKKYSDEFDGPHTIFVWAYFYDSNSRDILFGNYAPTTRKGLNMEKHNNNEMRYFRDWDPDWRGTSDVTLINEWNLLAYSRLDANTNPTVLAMENVVTGFYESYETNITDDPLTGHHYLGADARRSTVDDYLTTLNGLLGPVVIFRTRLKDIDTGKVLELTSPLLRSTGTPTPTKTSTCTPTASPAATPIQNPKHKRMELPVQYPPRSVIVKKQKHKG